MIYLKHARVKGHTTLRGTGLVDKDLSELISKADAILCAAQNQEWERVSEKAADWQGMLDSFFKTNTAVLVSEKNRVALRNLYDTNNQIIELVKKARDATAEKIREFNLGRKAIHNYGECHKGQA
jgi:hypothetical protein